MSYLCKISTSCAPAASQLHVLPVVFLLPPQNSRKCRCGVLVVCSIHAQVQHFMHLRQSDLRVFSFYFPCPTSHFRENEIVGGGIGCQIQSLQFYPSHFLPENSGICNCRDWGVIFVQNYNILCTCGKSNYIFFLCRFPFPTSNSRKCRCGVLVVCSIHAHAQYLMHLRQSDLRVFSFFPCSTSRFGKTKLWVVV